MFDTDSVPVAAPHLSLGADFWTGTLPPIHYRDRTAWRHWLSGTGAPLSFADRGEVLDEPILVLEAASHGRGIAIGFLPFIDKFVSSGRLSIVDHTGVRASRGYWVVVNEPNNPISQPFSEWIIEAASEPLQLTQ